MKNIIKILFILFITMFVINTTPSASKNDDIIEEETKREEEIRSIIKLHNTFLGGAYQLIVKVRNVNSIDLSELL